MDLQGEDFPDDATALEYASALARDLGKPTKAGRWSVEVLDAERRPVSVG